METDSGWAHTEPCAPEPGKRGSDPTRDWPRLARECPGVSGGGVGWAVACCMVGGAECSIHCHYLHHLHHSLASGQTAGRGHSPNLQQIIGLKIYWAWPCPSEQDPVSPSVSLSHQKASISLLSFSIRGQRDLKPQSQKTNQLITWTTALSNSMKL